MDDLKETKHELKTNRNNMIKIEVRILYQINVGQK